MIFYFFFFCCFSWQISMFEVNIRHLIILFCYINVDSWQLLRLTFQFRRATRPTFKKPQARDETLIFSQATQCPALKRSISKSSIVSNLFKLLYIFEKGRQEMRSLPQAIKTGKSKNKQPLNLSPNQIPLCQSCKTNIASCVSLHQDNNECHKISEQKFQLSAREYLCSPKVRQIFSFN